MESVFGTLFSRRVPPTDSSKRTRGKRPQPQPPQSLLTRLTRLWEDHFLLLTPSPQEHSAVRITTLDDDPTWRSRQNEYKHRAPPLGFIRLAFYSDLTKLYLDIEPDIESFIRLSPSGDLDLRKLRHQWGLETCAPIHPLKWKIEETADRDWMSPLAVHNNMDHQVNCIKFTEPTASPLTIYQRRLRAAFLVLLYPSMHVPTPEWWNRLNDMSPREYREFVETVHGFLFCCVVAWAWYNGYFTFTSVALWLRNVAWRLKTQLL